MTQAATKRTETKPTGVSAAAAFFCVLAAACTTVRVTLLLLELTAVVLLLCAGLARLLRPLAGRGTPLALAVFAVALAGAMHMALLAWRPAWWAELHMPQYYLTAFLAGAFAAQECAWMEHLHRYGWWALALLVLGCLREWLAYGRLMGVRLFWDGLSQDFGVGGLGLILAALLLAVCGLRQHWSWNYSIRESASAGWSVFISITLAGVVTNLLCRLDLPVWEETFWPALSLCVVLFIARGICRSPTWQTLLADPALAATGYATLLMVRHTTTVWWQGLLLICGAALCAGVLVAAFGAAASRLDSPGLPSRFKTSPALLATAGVALYAFAAF